MEMDVIELMRNELKLLSWICSRIRFLSDRAASIQVTATELHWESEC